ncbi:MAG: hypothetical protein QOG31_1169 [Thermoplasmata archaeon]|jgi:hypothetical protein|nr:hypothetical protein [Thermoplasmata archaeon]
MRSAWPALLAVALLSGCASAPAPPAGGGTSAPPQGAIAGDGALPLPHWAVRDYWTYTIGSGKATYVVTADDGADWMVDTDSPERAFQNARDDVSRLGPQRKGDLAGSQGDDRVQFFQWPLTEGKIWRTQWDHQELSITAHVSGQTAQMEGRDANGTRIYEYTYDAAVGWFRSLKHYAPDGKLLIALDLEGSGHAWTGNVVRYTLKTLYTAQGSNGGEDAKPLTPDVGATDLWLAYHLRCDGQGAGYLIALEPSSGPPTAGHTKSDQCAGNVDFEDGVPGSLATPWAILYAWGGQSMGYTIEVVQRTRESIQVA